MGKQKKASLDESSASLKVKNPTSLYSKAPTVYVRKSVGRFADLRLIARA